MQKSSNQKLNTSHTTQSGQNQKNTRNSIYNSLNKQISRRSMNNLNQSQNQFQKVDSQHMSSSKRMEQSSSHNQMKKQALQEQIQLEKTIQKNIDKFKQEISSTNAIKAPFIYQGQNSIPVTFQQVNDLMGIVNKSTDQNTNGKEKVPGYENGFDPRHMQVITQKQMKNRIKALNPNYKLSDINNMFPSKGEVNSYDLTEFLSKNKINQEEFKDGDPFTFALLQFFDNGKLNFNKISQTMEKFGYEKLNTKDAIQIKELLDLDEDGQVTLEDLKQCFSQQTIQEIEIQYQQKKQENLKNLVKLAFK